MNRRVLALLALAALVFLSGCTLFGNDLDEDDLLGDKTYDWESNATATYNLTYSSDSYATVLDLGNRTELSLSESDLIRGEESVGIGNLKFQFKNGTIVNATYSNLTASRGSDKTKITVPATNGTVAWTSQRSGKQWTASVLANGSHKVHLPGSARVGIPFLSQTGPDPDRSTVKDDRVTLFWSQLDDGSISVRYYLVRDLYLFGGMAGLGMILLLGISLYYFREIRSARKKREEVGLDVEQEDDAD
ncbi:DUF5803 family protein [Halovenus rubra]|uniref:DUF5803 family protein n=2 Tax=Halovenus rubra TaxID=869890 RepID=A0ABD5XAZ1_9EURY|nr:DUF5803 family protein [Halovenus rubra]